MRPATSGRRTLQFLVDPSDIRLATVTLANPYLETENDNVGVTLEYDLAFGTLRSITGYARSRTENLDDCAGMPLLQGCVRGGTLRFDQWSEEIQLLLHGTGPIDGLVGLYYFDADAADDLGQFIPLFNPNPTNAFRFTGDSGCHFWPGDPALRRTVERDRRAAPEPRRKSAGHAQYGVSSRVRRSWPAITTRTTCPGAWI